MVSVEPCSSFSKCKPFNGKPSKVNMGIDRWRTWVKLPWIRQRYVNLHCCTVLCLKKYSICTRAELLAITQLRLQGCLNMHLLVRLSAQHGQYYWHRIKVCVVQTSQPGAYWNMCRHHYSGNGHQSCLCVPLASSICSVVMDLHEVVNVIGKHRTQFSTLYYNKVTEREWVITRPEELCYWFNGAIHAHECNILLCSHCCMWKWTVKLQEFSDDE